MAVSLLPLLVFIVLLVMLGGGFLCFTLGRRGRRVASIVLLAGFGLAFVTLLGVRVSTSPMVAVNSNTSAYEAAQQARREVEATAAAIRAQAQAMQDHAKAMREQAVVAVPRPVTPPLVEPVEPLVRARPSVTADTPAGIVGVDGIDTFVAVEPSDTPLEAVALEPEPWRSAAELGFDADVYPSQMEAARVLLRKLLDKEATHPPAPFRIVGVQVDEPVMGSLATRLTERVTQPDQQGRTLEGPRVELVKENSGVVRTDEAFGGTTLRIEALGDASSWAGGVPAGTLRMTMTHAPSRSEATARFVEKPWVDNPSAYLSSTPGRRIIAFSTSQATSAAEARRQAVASGAAQLVPQVKSELARMPQTAVDDRWLLAQIQQDLGNGVGITDRFVQTFVRPYGGQLCREAILVDADAARQAVLQRCFGTIASTRATWAATIASAVGLLLFVCVVGAVLNMVTKGYYRGHVVLLGVVLLVLGTLVAYKMVGWRQAGVSQTVVYRPSAAFKVSSPASPRPETRVVTRKTTDADGSRVVQETQFVP